MFRMNLVCVFLIVATFGLSAGAEKAPYVSAKVFAHEKLDDKAISAALNDIGSSEKTLLLTQGKWTITKSIEIPSNVNLKIESGASFEIAEANTLSIQGSLETSGINQIFHGKGKVWFGPSFIQEVYPQWWGKVNTSDDTATCQAAIESGAAIVRFPIGVYNVNPVKPGPKTDPNDDAQWYGGLDLPSNITLIFDAGAKIKVIPNEARTYSIIRIDSKDNVKIYGATIEGERAAHKGTTGEWGHGILIRGFSTRIVIKDTSVTSCWGDGIYIGEGCPDGITVENSTFDNHRRNACSITNAKNVLFSNCVFSNTNGVSPHKGVDIEPNKRGDIIQNIVFQNCRSYKNLTKGFSVAYLGQIDNPVTVAFRGCYSDSDGIGFSIDSGPNDTAGVVSISDCVSINARETGFSCFAGNILTEIDGLHIINPNQGKSDKLQDGSGFVVWIYKDVNDTWAGNIHARDVHVTSTDSKALYAIYCGNDSKSKNTGFKDIDVNIMTNMPEDKRLYKGAGPYTGYCEIRFPDKQVNMCADVNSANK